MFAKINCKRFISIIVGRDWRLRGAALDIFFNVFHWALSSAVLEILSSGWPVHSCSDASVLFIARHSLSSFHNDVGGLSDLYSSLILIAMLTFLLLFDVVLK